jgi:hypothetical protein
MQEQWLREGEAWEWSIAFELGGVSVTESRLRLTGTCSAGGLHF